MYLKRESLKVYLLFVLLTALFSCSSKKIATLQEYTSYSYPAFLGSDSAYHDFATQNIKYPAEVVKDNVSTRVIANCLFDKDGSLIKVTFPVTVDFIINEDGGPEDPKVVESFSSKCDFFIEVNQRNAPLDIC